MALRANSRFEINSRLRAVADGSAQIGPGEQNQNAVRLLQRALVILGYPMPLSTNPDGSMDGIFGSETSYVVKTFQGEQQIKDSAGRVSSDTLDKLDELMITVRHHQLVEPDVVRQPQLTCWAAAIESLTRHRHTVAHLVRTYTRERNGSLASREQLDRVLDDVGISHRDSVIADIDNLSDTMLRLLLMKHWLFLCFHGSELTMAHCVVVYGIDGIGGKTPVVRYMDPLFGYKTVGLRDIVPRFPNIVLGFFQPGRRPSR